MGTLPSAQVLQAETDVVGAELIAIEYGSNYKVVTEKMSKELYVLTQCGTTKPSQTELADVLGRHVDYTVKHFTIPLQVASSSSTVHIAFFKALGVQDRIKYVSQYATGPCWQKALGCGGQFMSGDENASIAQISEVDAHFMDCGSTCDNVKNEAKGVHFSATQDPAPLQSAEHIKFMAAFFNKEELASQLFSATLASYASASVVVSPKPVVAWIQYTSWGGEGFELSQASYKLKMTADAGGANVDGAAVQARMGSNMSTTVASTGKTYKVLLSSFDGSKDDAAAAFLAGLGAVDVIVDETYAGWGVAPSSYTFETFMTHMGLVSSSSLPFMQNKKVLRIDGTISEKDNGLDWYESRVAHPDWAVEGLAHQIHADTSKKYMYFRNIANGEAPVVLGASSCTSTLPACDASSYATPISMMFDTTSTTTTTAAMMATSTMAEQTTSTSFAKCLSLLLLLVIAGAQV